MLGKPASIANYGINEMRLRLPGMVNNDCARWWNGEGLFGERGFNFSFTPLVFTRQAIENLRNAMVLLKF